jgi:hypothetical protein
MNIGRVFLMLLHLKRRKEMNVKKLSMSVISALAIISAPAYAITAEEQLAISEAIAAPSSLNVEENLASLAAQYPDAIVEIASASMLSCPMPSDAGAIKVGVCTEAQLLSIVQAAMTIAPEQAEAIALAAAKAGLSGEAITTAAITAGIDPTLIATATAAGPAVGDTNTGSRRSSLLNRGSGVSPS